MKSELSSWIFCRQNSLYNAVMRLQFENQIVSRQRSHRTTAKSSAVSKPTFNPSTDRCTFLKTKIQLISEKQIKNEKSLKILLF